MSIKNILCGLLLMPIAAQACMKSYPPEQYYPLLDGRVAYVEFKTSSEPVSNSTNNAFKAKNWQGSYPELNPITYSQQGMWATDGVRAYVSGISIVGVDDIANLTPIGLQVGSQGALGTAYFKDKTHIYAGLKRGEQSLTLTPATQLPNADYELQGRALVYNHQQVYWDSTVLPVTAERFRYEVIPYGHEQKLELYHTSAGIFVDDWTGTYSYGNKDVTPLKGSIEALMREQAKTTPEWAQKLNWVRLSEFDDVTILGWVSYQMSYGGGFMLTCGDPQSANIDLIYQRGSHVFINSQAITDIDPITIQKAVGLLPYSAVVDQRKKFMNIQLNRLGQDSVVMACNPAQQDQASRWVCKNYGN